MTKITAILEPDADGTLHLPLPAELRQGRIEITATLKPADSPLPASLDKVELRKQALRELRALGGLTDAIPDPQAWQREIRQDKPRAGFE